MSHDVLDALADRAFAALEAVGGDPRRLDEPLRSIAVVHAAQGVVDDGGLRYLFESDWPSRLAGALPVTTGVPIQTTSRTRREPCLVRS